MLTLLHLWSRGIESHHSPRKSTFYIVGVSVNNVCVIGVAPLQSESLVGRLVLTAWMGGPRAVLLQIRLQCMGFDFQIPPHVYFTES